MSRGESAASGAARATDDGAGSALAARLRSGDLGAAPDVLNLVETRSPAARVQTDALLRGLSPAVLEAEAAGHIVGVTGPPGAGKSTLLSELVAAWRALGDRKSVV